MSFRCSPISSRWIRRSGWVAVLLGAVLWHRAGAAPVLKVCVDSANPTRTMDSRVVRNALDTQGYGVQFVRFTGYGKGGNGFPVSRFATMAASKCALIMGFPVDASDPHLPPGVAATNAYASTGFVLVRRGDSRDESLGRLPKGSEVGIAEVDTYAGLLYSEHPNIVMHVYMADANMLKALEAGRIAAGLAWQPATEQFLHSHPTARPVQERIVQGRHMRWNLVALYVPQDAQAARTFDAGLSALRSSGRLATLVNPYAIAPAPRPGRVSALVPPKAAAVAATVDPPVPATVPVPATSAAPVKSAAPLKSPPPAVYTAAQAAAGALAYYQNCAMCHGPLLNGQEGGYAGPALKGADFADPSYDFHISDIFNFVAKLMPAASPGSLSADQDVKIMAFLLKQNGYPAGSQPLTYAAASKSSVPMLYYGK